jgi:hypothetical protein
MEKFLVELTDTELDAVAGGDSHGVAVASDGNVVVASADDVTITLGTFKISADTLAFGFSTSTGID